MLSRYSGPDTTRSWINRNSTSYCSKKRRSTLVEFPTTSLRLRSSRASLFFPTCLATNPSTRYLLPCHILAHANNSDSTSVSQEKGIGSEVNTCAELISSSHG